MVHGCCFKRLQSYSVASMWLPTLKIARISSQLDRHSLSIGRVFIALTMYTKRERAILVHNYHAVTNWLCNIHFHMTMTTFQWNCCRIRKVLTWKFYIFFANWRLVSREKRKEKKNKCTHNCRRTSRLFPEHKFFTLRSLTLNRDLKTRERKKYLYGNLHRSSKNCW